jgi:ribonuclease P protein component
VLPRRYRLTRSEDFARVREQGDCFASRRLVLCCHRGGAEQVRIGFSVSKRVGKAVVRNRVKRRLRASAYALREVIAPGWDLVVIARQSAAVATAAQLGAELDQLCGRARLLKGSVHAT